MKPENGGEETKPQENRQKLISLPAMKTLQSSVNVNGVMRKLALMFITKLSVTEKL